MILHDKKGQTLSHINSFFFDKITKKKQKKTLGIQQSTSKKKSGLKMNISYLDDVIYQVADAKVSLH